MAITVPDELRQAIEQPDWPRTGRIELARALAIASALGKAKRGSGRASDLASALASDLASDLALARGRARDIARGLAYPLASALASDLGDVALAYPLALASDLARAGDLARAVARASGLGDVGDVALAGTLAGVARAGTIASAGDLARALASASALGDNSFNDGEVTSELELFDWVGSIIYGLFVYAFADPDGAAPEAASGPTGAALSPVDDERIAFERLWSIVERALADDRLPEQVANEIRALNKMLGIVRHELDPDRYSDLFGYISDRLSRLLPDVLDALLEPGQPRPRSLQMLDASPEEQLDAIAADQEAGADAYDTAVEQLAGETADQDYQIPPPRVLPPYAPAMTQRLNEVFGRIDTNRATLAQYRTGRQFLRGVGQLGAAAATGIGVGLAAGAWPAAAAATGIAVAQWLYTRLRRQIPDLPPLNLPADPTEDATTPAP